jgi:hypothetical protein
MPRDGVPGDNIFDLGGLDLKASLTALPRMTEWGCLRINFNFDLIYEIVSYFIVNLGFILNYDNQRIRGATGVDYDFQTTVGWKLLVL